MSEMTFRNRDLLLALLRAGRALFFPFSPAENPERAMEEILFDRFTDSLDIIRESVEILQRDPLYDRSMTSRDYLRTDILSKAGRSPEACFGHIIGFLVYLMGEEGSSDESDARSAARTSFNLAVCLPLALEFYQSIESVPTHLH